MALFDVSNPKNPKELHSVDIGDRGTYSEILDNHKALLFSKEKNIIAFPIRISEEIGEYTTKSKFQGAIVYGLDLENVELFKKLLMKLKGEKKIILLSSHQYHNIEHFCDQVVYLKEGKILFKGDITKLKMKYKQRIVSIHTKKDLFKKEKGIVSSYREKEYQILEVENKEIANNLICKLIEMGIEDFKMEQVSLTYIIKEKSL